MEVLMTDQPHPILYARLESLKKKHEKLDSEISQEQSSAAAVDYYLKQLKRRKLLVKDQMQAVMSDLRDKTANAY